MTRTVIVWLALGFGLGRLPKAPGTFGSLLGIVWFVALSYLSSLSLFLAAVSVSFFLGVWICTQAELILKQHDPGCIVIDEIVALPIAGLGWVLWYLQSGGGDTRVLQHLDWGSGLWLISIFALFRFFDIAKPWPVGISQKLDRGWGVMTDDLLAGIYVALLSYSVRWLYAMSGIG